VLPSGLGKYAIAGKKMSHVAWRCGFVGREGGKEPGLLTEECDRTPTWLLRLAGVAIKGMYAPLTNMDAFSRHKQMLALYKKSQEAPPPVRPGCVGLPFAALASAGEGSGSQFGPALTACLPACLVPEPHSPSYVGGKNRRRRPQGGPQVPEGR
jgi:hypothetical protein